MIKPEWSSQKVSRRISRMPAQKQQQIIAESWQPGPEFPGRKPAAELCSWLLEPGLLTARLRTQCAAHFHLEVINDIHSSADTTALHRQVVLWCGEAACICAETIIPVATAIAHPWLRKLGDEPLGERLQSQQNVTRSGFEYALMNPDSLPDDISIDSTAALWARRSDFFIGSDALTVTEIFLPAVVHCGSGNFT
jgi:chorismate-pyruvate lyase